MINNFAAKLWTPVNHLLNLVFPNLCAACNATMPPKVHCFCFSCQTSLTQTEMHLEKENIFTQRIWGRIPFTTAAAMYHYQKNTPIQRALHKLKYENRPDIGLKLGRIYGRQLVESENFNGLDGIIPVPLHPKKLKFRGYNQAEVFAKGLSESMEIPVLNLLKRNIHTDSQTRKNRLERNENMENVFFIPSSRKFTAQKILLVDDVLTSGATLERCGEALLENHAFDISFATIAIAHK